MLNKKNFRSFLLFVSCLVGSVSSQVQAEGMSSSAATLKPYVTLGANWVSGSTSNHMNMFVKEEDPLNPPNMEKFSGSKSNRMRANSLGGYAGLGFLAQRGQFLYGLEASFDYTRNKCAKTISGQDALEFTDSGSDKQLYNSLTTELTRTYAGKILAQVGYAITPEWHILARAGVVNSRFKYKASYKRNETPAVKGSRAAGRNLWGGVIGCGILYNFNAQWSVELNYEHQIFSAKKQFPNLDSAENQSLRPKINPHYHVVGINFRRYF